MTKVGEIFFDARFGAIVCREDTGTGCAGCPFSDTGESCPDYNNHPCASSEREDGKEVTFRRVDTSQGYEKALLDEKDVITDFIYDLFGAGDYFEKYDRPVTKIVGLFQGWIIRVEFANTDNSLRVTFLDYMDKFKLYLNGDTIEAAKQALTDKILLCNEESSALLATATIGEKHMIYRFYFNKEE